MRAAFLSLAAALTSVACATAVRLTPVTPGSAADPSSPEPPPATMSQTLHPEAPPHAEEESMPSATVYTCPMHPEVQSDVPGTCPKCGMKLVPVKPAPDPGSPK